MAQVRCTLSGLLTKHQRLGVDQAESINDHFSFDRLDGIDDDGDGSGGELLERLLGVDIHARQPTTETRMGVVPANNGLGPATREKLVLWSVIPFADSYVLSYLPVCRSISIIFIWKTGSTASTLTPVPLCGIANTSTTRTVKSSTNSPNIKPMTSMGTPARPCRSIFKSAREEI